MHLSLTPSQQSGFATSVTSGLDNAFTGTGSQRADFLGGTASLGSGRSHGEMVARFFNIDLGVVKNTKITERVSTQFRAEFFNVLNNVNFRNPATNASSAQIGRITSAADPRILQFALKIVF